jgi:PAS domain-containing protein
MPVIVTDEAHRIALVNQAAVAMLGLYGKDWQSKPVRQAVHHEVVAEVLSANAKRREEIARSDYLVLFERDGTSCENLPESHAYLKEIRAFIDEHYPGRLLLAEANRVAGRRAAIFRRRG